MGGGGRGGEGGGGRDFLTPSAPWLCAGRVGQRRVGELKKRNPRGLRLPTGEPCIPMGSKVPSIWPRLMCSEDSGYPRHFTYTHEVPGIGLKVQIESEAQRSK